MSMPESVTTGPYFPIPETMKALVLGGLGELDVAALGPGIDEYEIGERVTVEIHAGCRQCERCREGMYTCCHNYGLNCGDVNKGHRANGFTSDGGFCEYAVNNINTLVRVPDDMSDEEATLVVTAGTAMHGPRATSIQMEDPGPWSLLGAKGIGEPALVPPTSAIINAIYDAIGVRIASLPASPEKIVAALAGKHGGEQGARRQAAE